MNFEQENQFLFRDPEQPNQNTQLSISIQRIHVNLIPENNLKPKKLSSNQKIT